MGVYIKHWSLADWKELLKWAKIGANNAMIGEFTEVEELPPHGDLIDRSKLTLHNYWYGKPVNGKTHFSFVYNGEIQRAEAIIEAEDGE